MTDKTKEDAELDALMDRYGMKSSKASESKPTPKIEVPVQASAPPPPEVVEEPPIRGNALILAQERQEEEQRNKPPENVIERNRGLAETGAVLGGMAQYKGVGQKLMQPAMDLFAHRDANMPNNQKAPLLPTSAPTKPVTDIEHILQSGQESRPNVTGRQKESGHNWETNRQALTQTGIEKTRPVANPMQNPIVQAGPMVPTASGIAIPKSVAVSMEQELQAKQAAEAEQRKQLLAKQEADQQRAQQQKARLAQATGATKGTARIGQGIVGGAIAAPQLFEYGRDVASSKPADQTQALSGLGGLAMALGKNKAGFLGGLAQIPYAVKNRDEIARSLKLSDVVPDTVRMGMTGSEMYEPANAMPVRPTPVR